MLEISWLQISSFDPTAENTMVLMVCVVGLLNYLDRYFQTFMQSDKCASGAEEQNDGSVGYVAVRGGLASAGGQLHRPAPGSSESGSGGQHQGGAGHLAMAAEGRGER